MPKYNQSNVVGESWRRSCSIKGYNQYGQNPILGFDEEDIVLLEDGQFLTKPSQLPGYGLFAELTQETVSEQFQLRNPETEEYIEQYATYQDVFILIHSLYFHLAQKRDRGPQPFQSWSWDEEIKQWISPIPYPDDGQIYSWDENSQEWIVSPQGE